jgi:hypothetical protein
MPAMESRTEQWLFGGVIAVLAVALLAFAWFRYGRAPEPAEPETPPAPAADSSAGEAPASAPPAAADVAPAEPLPPLSDSDPYVKLELDSLFGSGLEELLAKEAVIEKFVATVDNLPRDKLAERLRPVGKLSGSFTAVESTAADRYEFGPDNEQRYDYLVSLLTTTPTDDLVKLYGRFYPLFQEAYVGLGYPDGEFHARLLEVLDHLAATPEPEGSPALVRPHVLYQYADADLEALSSGQKILLRMGPQHRAAVRERLDELRDALGPSAPVPAGGN